MNILILGGAGFLGNNLVRKCLEKGAHTITVVDSLDPRLHSTKESLSDILSKITFLQGDIRDAALMEKVVKGQEIIFNCAAQTSHPLSLQDPLYDTEINCLGNLTVLEAIRSHNKKARVVYTSSSTLIGRAISESVDETHGEKPLDVYSANKGVAEKYYYLYARVHGLTTLSLRFANLYGPYGKAYPEFGFINYFINQAAQGKDITIYGDGNQVRNVMYAEDAADLMYECAQKPETFNDVYFAVHREHLSVADIAKEIVSVFKKGSITHIPWPEVRKKIEIDNVYISGEKLYGKTGWEPKFTFRQGLEKTKEVMDSL